MNLVINEVLWKQIFVDKLLFKHNVSIDEAEDIFLEATQLFGKFQKAMLRVKMFMRHIQQLTMVVI